MKKQRKQKKHTKKKQEKKCQHKWVPLLAKYKGQIISTSVKACLKCGDLKIGVQTIKISRFRLDMGDLPINNAKSVLINSDDDSRLKIPVGTNRYD